MADQPEYIASPRDWVREQVELYERTDGEQGNTLRDTGLPIIIVHTFGAKTGALRKIPLMRVEHDGEYALVASYGGSPAHPVWYHNLLAYPDDVALQDGPQPFPVTVREVFDDEKARWWERSVAAFPTYAEYQTKTDRPIPVFIATPR